MSNGKTKHTYHAILNAIAEGDEIQYLLHPSSSWKTLSAESFLQAMVNGDLGNPEYYRVKPKTININGYEVLEPVRTKLNDGDTYYIPDIFSCDFYTADWWSDTDQDLKFLNLGLIHLTKEAAVQHAKSLLSFTAKVDN